MKSIKKYYWAAAIALLLIFVGPSVSAQDTLRTLIPATLSAQDTLTLVPTASAEEDTIIGGSADLQFSQSVPLAGNRTLNRISGRQTYDESYSHFFCEFEYLLGSDIARGANFTYMWKRWGAYGSLLGGYYSPYYSLGGTLRVFTQPAGIDWQVYGGFAGANYGVGYEFGTRIAANAKVNGGTFGWWSGSIGMMSVGGTSFTTIGLSIAIIGCTGFIVIL